MKKSKKTKYEECKQTYQVLRTIGGYCTVAITAVFCQDCGKQLSKTKVEV